MKSDSSSLYEFRWIFRVMLFSIVLCYFVLSSGWYEPSRLEIKGQCQTGNPVLRVNWDSGAGFNGYEKREFRPLIKPLNKNHSNKILLGGVGRRNGASLSNEVFCAAIVIDGKEIDLGALDLNVPLRDGELFFSQGKTISLTVPAYSQIGFKFRTNNHSGIAYVSVNGVEAEYDLYVANVEAKFKQINYWLIQDDGSFKVAMDMPRYTVDTLKISAFNDGGAPLHLTSVAIHGKGHVVDLLQEPSIILGERRFFNVLDSMYSRYSPVQLFQQVVFALLTTWLLTSLVQLYYKTGGIMASFFKGKRYVFWLMFGGSLLAFGLWLVAFWPGVMSVDSLKVWRAATLPDVYLNDHPVLNVILYKYLFQICGNPVIVPVVHILLVALLISWFFFGLYNQGVTLKIILPCFLFILMSVPLGTYNITLWKDVPFALLVVFWACTLVKFYWQRSSGQFFLSGQYVTALILAGLSLGLIRHNGLVYWIVLPMMFVFLRLVSVKKTIILLLFFVGSGLIAYGSLQKLEKVPGTDFVTQELNKYVSEVSIENVVQNYGRITQDYLSVLDFNQTDQKWDRFHFFLKDRYAYWFLLHSGWWDVYPYKKEVTPFPWLKQLAMKVYNASYEKLWIWVIWNPVFLLALLPVTTLLFWRFPSSAILGAVLFAGALPLIYLRIFNWRYYYFLYLGLLFLLPMISLDLSRRKLHIEGR